MKGLGGVAGSPSPGSRQGKKRPCHAPGGEGARVAVQPTPALIEVVPTRRVAPVTHRTPTLAGGPMGDGSRRISGGGQAPPEELQ